MQLSDYAQALGAAQALIPQWDQPERDRAALQGQQVQNQLGQQQVVAATAANAAQQQTAERHAAFEAALRQAGSNPDPAHLRAIGTQFPEFAEPLLKTVDGMERSHRDQVFRDTSQVYAGLGNAAGYAGARSIIQRHVDADRAAGREPDPTDMDMLTAIDSGDPAKIATARGLARAIATAAYPEGAKTLFSGEAEEASSTSDGAIYMTHGPRAGTVVRQGVVRESNALPVPIYDDQGHRVGTQLIPNGGRGGGPVSSGSVPATGAEIEALATGAIPGIQVTSRQRSAAHNAAVGGVPNSFHLTDQARDFTPPAGTSLSALAGQLRTALPGFQVIQESDHVHVEPQGHPGQRGGGQTIGPVRAAAGSGDAQLDAPTISTMAEQYLAGDQSVLTNLGRGRQGSANIVKLRSEIARQARSRGMTGAQIAAQMVQFKGDAAAMRTAGTRSANADLAVTEARNLIPLALRASDALPRASFLPFSRAEQAYRSNTNNPLYREFVAANNSLVNTYARAISPTGASTESDKHHAREMLDTAFDQASYRRVVAQLDREMQAALSAPGQVRQDIYRNVGGGGGHAAPAGGPRQVRTLQEAMALPKGTVFLDPRGVRRVR